MLADHAPETAAVEAIFVSKNGASTLKLGQARGVVMLAPARAALPVHEYAANAIKKSVVGAGHADKAQIGAMVRMLMPGCQPAGDDAADALAVAICHAHHAATNALWEARRDVGSGRGAAVIAALNGRVDSVTAEGAVIDVGGVGYQVFASAQDAGRAAAAGEPIKLAIETHVREDHIHLFGFVDAAERDWFRLLTTVQGVGARVALAILSVLDPDALTTALAAQDKTALTRADGVGPKLAARILNELRDKTPLGDQLAAPAPAVAGAAGARGADRSDAISALVNLGYGRSEAFGAVGRAAQALGDDAGVEALIREGLKELGA